MKKCLLTILLIHSVIIAFSQSLQTLQQQYREAKTAKEKIYALDDLASYYTQTVGGDSMAEVYSHQLMRIAEESGSKELIAESFRLKGFRLIKLFNEDKTNDGRALLEEAASYAKENNLPYYEANAYASLSFLSLMDNESNADVASHWGNRALTLANAIRNDSLKVLAEVAVANAHRIKTDYTAAFRTLLDAERLAKKTNNPYLLSYCYGAFSNFFKYLEDHDKALEYNSFALKDFEKKTSFNSHDLYWLYAIKLKNYSLYMYKKDYVKAKEWINRMQQQTKAYAMPDFYTELYINGNISLAYANQRYKEAISYLTQPDIEKLYLSFNSVQRFYSHWKGQYYFKAGQIDSAEHYFKKSLSAPKDCVPIQVASRHLYYGRFLLQRGRYREAIQQLETVKALCLKENDFRYLVNSLKYLDTAYYKTGDLRKAYEYRTLYYRFSDSLKQQSKQKEVALLVVQHEQKKLDEQRLQQQEALAYRNRIRTYSLLSGVGILVLIASILYRNNRQKQKTNAQLHQQKKEIELQKAKTEKALEELKATQAQLVQKEKMASLGELTAGIAHEIQNPLNFVNNFSEVSTELMDDLTSEATKGNTEEVAALASNIKQNLHKIAHHGKRADAIVKGMLEHSRTSKGEKQATDINVLTEEYLRLAYHNIRTKDRSINAIVETHFDPSIGKLSVVPQEVGKVLLSLLSNAFYSVNEKKQQLNGSYEPVISVSTKKINGSVMISVRDNGTGISQKNIEKIYQPFFTTKPTGEGTGLGLSLSYDIITKGHGGELKVDTKDGEYAEFVVQLPA